MSFWREKRSFSVLVLGLFFLLMAWYPWPFAEFWLSRSSSLLAPIASGLRGLQFFSSPSSGKASPADVPDALWLAQREANFWRPRDPQLLSRTFAFAHRSAMSSEAETFWLDAGEEQGVKEGMFVLAGDVLLGVVDRVMTQRCRVRTLAHPDSQVGARTQAAQFVAAGASRGKVRVELPSGRDLGIGAEVRADAVPAIMGTIATSPSGRRGSLVVRQQIDPATVQGAWLLHTEQAPTSAKETVLLPRPPETTPASFIWNEISPYSRGALLSVEADGQLHPGAAITIAGRFAGMLRRVESGLCWTRWLGDPSLRFQAILARDDGVLVSFPKFSCFQGGAGEWALSAELKGIGEGWLFTGAETSGIPKGLCVGRVLRRDEGYVLETLEVTASSEVKIYRNEERP